MKIFMNTLEFARKLVTLINFGQILLGVRLLSQALDVPSLVVVRTYTASYLALLDSPVGVWNKSKVDITPPVCFGGMYASLKHGPAMC